MKYILNSFLLVGLSLFGSNIQADSLKVVEDGAQNSATKDINSSARYGTLLGDFNADGILDFVAADQPGYLSIRLGVGNGNFGIAKFTALAGKAAHSLAISDFNGDGKLDIVANGAGKITILLGRNNGTFNLKPVISTAFDQSVVVADVNSDARADIVTSGNTGVAVRWGNGNGSFTAEKYYLTESGAATNISVADFNFDGTLDIVASGASAIARIFLGEGNGKFRNGQPISLGISKASAQAVADVDKDDLLDLVVTGSGNISVLRGSGNGSFASPLLSLSSTNAAIALADLNVDGVLDAITSASNGLSISFGIGNGTFIAPLTPMAAQSGSSTVLLTTDINGDAKTDLLVSGFNSSKVGVTTVKFGEGNGTFHPSGTVSFVNGINTGLSRIRSLRIR